MPWDFFNTIKVKMAAIIYLNIPGILETVPHSLTITIKQNMRLQGRMIHPENFQRDQIQNMPDIWQTVPDS